MSWSALERAAPDLAEFGAGRFAETGVAYLATIAKSGRPRVHPVTPVIAEGRLMVFMETTSPKGHDLRRGSPFALHAPVGGTDGEGGEFAVSGHGVAVEDPRIRALAEQAASYSPEPQYVLFELSVESASSTVYEAGKPVRRNWATAERDKHS